MSIQRRYLRHLAPASYDKTLEAITETPADDCFYHLDCVARECGLVRVDDTLQYSDTRFQRYEHLARFKFLYVRARWLIGTKQENSKTSKISVSIKYHSSIYLWLTFPIALLLCILYIDIAQYKLSELVDDPYNLALFGVFIVLSTTGFGILIKVRDLSLRIERQFWPRLSPLGPWLWSQEVTRGRYGIARANKHPHELPAASGTSAS